MNSFITEHLDLITIESLYESRQDAFVSSCSYTTSRGMVELGFNCFGKFVVKRRDETWIFDTPEEAKKKYADLLIN